jgi:hypothetical protein
VSDDQIVALVFVGIGVVAAIGFTIAHLRDELRTARRRSREARDVVRALVALDPSLLQAFGRREAWEDWDPIVEQDDRVLDVPRLLRLAETRRTLAKRDTGRAELDYALAALAEARRDEA